MKQFKIGDVVRRIAGYHSGMSVGDTAKITGFYDCDLYLEGYEGSHTYTNFELVQDDKEPTKQFLKENKWFIRTGSPEKSKLVQEWLFEHGMEWIFGEEFGDYNEKYLTNTDSAGDRGDFIMYGFAEEKTNAQEIKLKFETVVKSVQLPEVQPKKTEQQLLIEELEATIAQASAQIKQLKEEM